MAEQGGLLVLENVVKRYASKLAVDHLSLNIPKGQIFGLLGPNGAGKTSTIRMITRITRADSGTMFFRGEPLRDEHQQFIGYMPEERGLYKRMKVEEQLLYILQLKGMRKPDARQKIDYWLERFSLSEWRNNKVSELSKGMSQKVQFIATIAHNPPLLILDEPFSGLDPVNTQLLEDIIFELRDAGTTIIFSTHRMEQVEELCEAIALISDGKIVLEGGIQEIQDQFRKNFYQVELQEVPQHINWPNEAIERSRSKREFRLELPKHQSREDFFRNLIEQFAVLRVEHETPSLRDIFIEIVHKGNGPE